MRPMYAIQGAETACAAVDGEVRGFGDCGGEEDGVFIGLAVADAGVEGHGER
jgi:hypothetical protein